MDQLFIVIVILLFHELLGFVKSWIKLQIIWSHEIVLFLNII